MREAIGGLLEALSGYGSLWLAATGLAVMLATAAASLGLNVLRLAEGRTGAARSVAFRGIFGAGALLALAPIGASFGANVAVILAALAAVAVLAGAHGSAVRRKSEGDPEFAQTVTVFDWLLILGLGAAMFLLIAPRLMVWLK
ncbi:hypothetical protein [Neomegalonema sp.]|uniref:hypothetical protein n=1 Tax=Neomegalonema sp. TaxID=2039713 RepID=UPI00262A80C6|nr:hypothetical protein [Neomegalonema sp.]MDD2868945.1 hypothetical protein [Neomegalonema sp.]